MGQEIMRSLSLDFETENKVSSSIAAHRLRGFLASESRRHARNTPSYMRSRRLGYSEGLKLLRGRGKMAAALLM